MTCSNCGAEALFVYAPRGLVPTPYCNTHLPRRLRKATEAEGLTRTQAYETRRNEVVAMLAVETRVPEPEPAQEAPKRKRRRRSGAQTDAVEDTQPSDQGEGEEIVSEEITEEP